MAAPAILKIDIIADASKASREMGKVEGTGSKLKTWAKGVGTAIAGAFAIDQVRRFIDAGAELQDQIGASGQIFGRAAKSVVAWSKDSATAFGVSQSDALAAANTFATFGKAAGLTGQDLGGFSTDLTELAGDLASFRGTSTEQAIDAIGAALRGESEPIRAYGVLLDDATLRQQALAMGLIKTTKQALTPQQKVLAAQAQIFKQTKDAQGDYARTADSAANSQKTMAAQVENLQAAIGTALLPVVSMVTPILGAMAGFIAENARWLVPLAAAIGAVVVAQWAWNAAMAANPLTLVALAIAAVIVGVILLVKNWDKVTAAFKAAFAWLRANWPLLLAILTGPFGAAVLIIVRNWDTIRNAALAVFRWFGTTWSTLAAAITSPFRAAWNAISGIIDTIRRTVSGVLDTARDVAHKIGAALKAPINAVIRGWNGLEFKVPKMDLGPFGSIGGQTIGFPNIPELATGGSVLRTGLAIVHRGETFSGIGGNSSSPGTTIHVHVTTTGLGADAPQIQRAVVQALRGFTARNGAIDVPIRSAT